jgi:hypothetical protein
MSDSQNGRNVVTHECPRCKGGAYGPGECRGHLAAGFHTPYALVPITPTSHHWKSGSGEPAFDEDRG